MDQPLEEEYANEVIEAYQMACFATSEMRNLMLRRVPYEDWPQHLKIADEAYSTHELMHTGNDLSDKILKRIQDMGRIEERIKSILDQEIFEQLSKHNPYWDSEDEKTCDKFYDLRMTLSAIYDNLWDIMGIIRKEQE